MKAVGSYYDLILICLYKNTKSIDGEQNFLSWKDWKPLIELRIADVNQMVSIYHMINNHLDRVGLLVRLRYRKIATWDRFHFNFSDENWSAII